MFPNLLRVLGRTNKYNQNNFRQFKHNPIFKLKVLLNARHTCNRLNVFNMNRTTSVPKLFCC